MKAIKVIAVLTVLTFIIVMCWYFIFPYTDYSCRSDKYRKGNIEELLKLNLSPGFSQKSIESFFDSEGIPYTFDSFQRRYQTAISLTCGSEPEGYRKLIIYTYLDENLGFDYAAVKYAFRG